MANYPVPYQNNWGFSGIGQQMYPQFASSLPQTSQATAQTQQNGSLIWVDGEVGAKAYQLPQGLPANQPIALWDTNDTVIYLKSVNPMGMPNPLQIARYQLEGTKSGEAKRAFSGNTEVNMSEYVRKDDLERIKKELMDAIHSVDTSDSRHGKVE